MSKRKVMERGCGFEDLRFEIDRQDESGGGDGTGVAAVAGEGVFHGAPAGGVVGEQVGDAAGEGFGRVGEVAAADGFEQPEVSLLLAGDEVVDEHRAAGGDGLMHGGSAGLADDEVVAVEELRDPARPADEADAAGVGVLDFPGPRSRARGHCGRGRW